MAKFKSSLRIGQQGEEIVRKHLEGFGLKTKESADKQIDLIFIHDGIEFTCEIKFDLYATKSGNCCIEFYNTKTCKPSGLASTPCIFWFHVLNSTDIYFSFVSSLREFTEKTKPKRTVNGGDDNSAMMLYEKEVICGNCLIELTEENLKKELKKWKSK